MLFLRKDNYYKLDLVCVTGNFENRYEIEQFQFLVVKNLVPE